MRHIILLVLIFSLTSCAKLKEKWAYMRDVEHKAAVINQYEKTALALAKENRELSIQIMDLKYELQKLKTQNSYLTMQVDKKDESKAERKIASIPVAVDGKDMVEQGTYKWSSEELLALAEKEFEEKHFEKSAQLYQTLLKEYPASKEVNETTFFQAGMASYEAGRHEWTMKTLGLLTQKYPSSRYFRGARLWMALTDLKLGREKDFFKTVEDFRKKYRNTPEWTILSDHYEKIMQKYKN